MAEYSREEIAETYRRLIETRDRAEAGDVPWSALAEFFVEEGTYIDPAWGRYDGLDEIRRFMDESMGGLEGWTFPEQWTMIEGNRLVSCWMNRLPGQRPDGSYYEAPGISTLYYAGSGKFRSSEDLLNMVHVRELIRESGWKPRSGFKAPPQHPRR